MRQFWAAFEPLEGPSQGAEGVEKVLLLNSPTWCGWYSEESCTKNDASALGEENTSVDDSDEAISIGGMVQMEPAEVLCLRAGGGKRSGGGSGGAAHAGQDGTGPVKRRCCYQGGAVRTRRRSASSAHSDNTSSEEVREIHW